MEFSLYFSLIAGKFPWERGSLQTDLSETQARACFPEPEEQWSRPSQWRHRYAGHTTHAWNAACASAPWLSDRSSGQHIFRRRILGIVIFEALMSSELIGYVAI